MFNVSNTELVHSSFYITYAFLMTTATITFIESIRTKDAKIRNILNLETCISVVAAFFYGSRFMFESKSGDASIVTRKSTIPLFGLVHYDYYFLVLVLALL